MLRQILDSESEGLKLFDGQVSGVDVPDVLKIVKSAGLLFYNQNRISKPGLNPGNASRGNELCADLHICTHKRAFFP